MKKTILLLFCSAITINGFSQSDVSGPGVGHRRAAGRFVGWSPGLLSVAGSLDVKNEFVNEHINFFAGGSTAAFQRMTILGTTGFVGVGNNFTTPLNLVDVRDGNINIGQGIAGNIAASPQSYMIGGQNILWHKGDVRNLFVGVGS